MYMPGKQPSNKQCLNLPLQIFEGDAISYLCLVKTLCSIRFVVSAYYVAVKLRRTYCGRGLIIWLFNLVMKFVFLESIIFDPEYRISRDAFQTQ